MIMIVDDDLGMADACSMYLEAHGYDVTVAASGSDALVKLAGSAHELLISDFVMPGMSGLELSANVRANPLTAGVPILLMSANRRCELGETADFDGFIRKPFLAESLLREVRNLLPPHVHL